MFTSRKPMAEKVIIVGIDGMDPRFTRKMLAKGLMPNTQKVLDLGSANKDLQLLGGQPTVTPPMWTTLATGAYPYTHGITCFYKQVEGDIGAVGYGLDSRDCLAEPLWNITAEAGYKTLVWNWPGSSWPPTSDNPNLLVIDGTQPGNVNMGVATVDKEKVLVADVKTEAVAFRAKAASDSHAPCVIDDLEVKEDKAAGLIESALAQDSKSPTVFLSVEEGEGALSDHPFDLVYSPVSDAKNWEFDIPEGAREFTMLHSGGLTRRPCLILKNEQGVYDHVRIYKNKKDANGLIAELQNDVFTPDIIDEAIKDNKKCMAKRSMRILEMTDDGKHIRIWISDALDVDNDTVWHPKRLFKEVVDAVGAPRPISITGGNDERLLRGCMIAEWDASGEWMANAIHALIEKEDLDVVFSQFHCVDLQSHMVAKFLKNGHNDLSAEGYQKLYEEVYEQTDRYIGHYLDLIDKGWTVLVLSDHGLVCADYGPVCLCNVSGINAGIMAETGLTVLKKDENGNDMHEVDWTKTVAVQNRGNHIYLNIKGRDKHTLPDGTVIDGIVDPKDKWEVEEQVITALYGYKSPNTGKRVVELAIRNKDAVLLGMGGDRCGDILVWLADGYTWDHCDSLSTCFGYDDTSTSPIFLGAGPGLKEGFRTDRVIREVDVAPTVAALLGVRMPAQCEGAPVYQILTEEL